MKTKTLNCIFYWARFRYDSHNIVKIVLVYLSIYIHKWFPSVAGLPNLYCDRWIMYTKSRKPLLHRTNLLFDTGFIYLSIYLLLLAIHRPYIQTRNVQFIHLTEGKSFLSFYHFLWLPIYLSILALCPVRCALHNRHCTIETVQSALHCVHCML